MFHNREIAEEELKIAGQLNQGTWTDHSINVGLAAQTIAKRCGNLNPEKAYVLGLLHDIGRRYGVSARRHGIDEYNFVMERGFNEVGRICLTHSFPVPDFEKEISKNDMSDKES
jgi:HD superfamily phosphodiesterase